MPLVAKLERPEAIASLDDILRACDAVMVARGDLGLELPLQSGAARAEGHHARARARWRCP
jgi:pyruvate kinase